MYDFAADSAQPKPEFYRELLGAADADVSVSTFSGEFETDLPVTISGTTRAGRQFGFTLGRGGAQLHLESFDGTIRLERAGR